MISNNIYSDIYTEEEISASKDNFFEILGELYNGEVFKIILAETEREIKKEFKVTLPDGEEELEKLEFNDNKKLFNLIINCFMNLLILLNPMGTESEKLYALKISIITATCLAGTLSNEKNYVKSNIKFDKQYIRDNKNKISEENMNIIKQAIEFLPLANNFLAFSTINFVKFNHHYPSDKVHLIRKALLSFDSDVVDELLEEENKDTFYNILVSPARICNELLFYEKILNKEFRNLHNTKFKYYRLLGTNPLEFQDEVINIRKVCTPNGFIILDLIKSMIDDIKAKNVLFLLPNAEIFSKILKLREYIRKNPFAYHPSKLFHHCMAEDFKEVREKFLNYMSIVGGFVFFYTSKMEDSVIQAKCRNKYKNKVSHKDEKIVNLLLAITISEVKTDDNTIKVLKEKMNTQDIVLDENINIEEENKKVENIFNNKDADF